MLHCAQFLPPHPPISIAVLLSRRSRPRLSCSAPCNPLGGDSYYFHFSNSVGGRETSVQHTPSPPSTSLPPSLPPFGPSLSLSYLHFPLRWPVEKEKYLYLSVSSRATSPYPLPALTPCSLLSATPLSASTFEILSVSRTFFFLFFLFLSPSYFHLPLLTAPRRRASARSTEREREREREGGGV